MAAAPAGTLPVSACKEQMSRAYVLAVAAAARCSTATPEPDYDGVDIEIRQSAEHERFTQSRLEVQLKATSSDVVRDDHVAFRLKAEHYDKLRDEKVYVPRILVVLVLPPGDVPDRWLYQHPRAMLLRHCAYWVSLRGAPAIAGESTTVHVPLDQRFNVSHLLCIMQRIGDGALP